MNILALQQEHASMGCATAKFCLTNGQGVAVCQWINAELGLFKFIETGEASCALNVPNIVEAHFSEMEALDYLEARTETSM